MDPFEAFPFFIFPFFLISHFLNRMHPVLRPFNCCGSYTRVTHMAPHTANGYGFMTGSHPAPRPRAVFGVNTARKWLRVYDGLASRPVIGVNTARKWLRIYDGYYSATIIIG